MAVAALSSERLICSDITAPSIKSHKTRDTLVTLPAAHGKALTDSRGKITLLSICEIITVAIFRKGNSARALKKTANREILLGVVLRTPVHQVRMWRPATQKRESSRALSTDGIQKRVESVP